MLRATAALRRAALVWRRTSSSSPSHSGESCWSCGGSCPAAPPPLFCPTCRALQPHQPGLDLFRLMGCDRSFRLEAAQLQRSFRTLQRLLHPDNFSRRTEAERGLSEQQSSLVNKAYQTLRSPLSRGLYLLELSGMELEQGTDSAADPAFLSQVLELNERLAQAGDNKATLETLQAHLAAEQEELTEAVGRAFDQGDLQKAKKLLAKMKYFANLEDKVKAKKVPP